MTVVRSGSVAKQKDALRLQMRARRDALSATKRDQLSGQACARLGALPVFAHSLLVATFRAFRSEADPGAATDGRFQTVVFPRIATGLPGPRLRFHRGDSWRDGPFGLTEPDAACPEVPAAAIPVFVVPGLAFDRAGRRLGYGGGYYDELAAHLPASARPILIGFAFAFQLVDRVPVDAGDAQLDFVVTEQAVVDCRRHRTNEVRA